MINEQEIRKVIAIMKPDGQLFEVRMVYDNKSTYSGYFRSADSLMAAFDGIRDFANCNIYITLNSVNDACYDRTQKDHFSRGTKATTSDNDITKYDWLMVDVDPRRPTGTSSTDAQIEAAKKKGNAIYSFMRDLGFSKPLTGFSGNGVHLMYHVDLENTNENKELIEKSLKTLSMLFSDQVVDVDTANFNPSRICKLYGTEAQKGANTAERPHRMSHIVGDPTEIKTSERSYLEKLCDLYPKEEKPQRYNNYRPKDFDLDEWLNRYGIRYKTEGYSDGTKYVLDCCPFDSNHKGKDACIFRSRNGAIGFHCFHNSCSDKTWRDVRIKYEPEAYERRKQEYEKRIYDKRRAPHPKIEEQDGRPVFYTANDILHMPMSEEVFIKSGIELIDEKMRGLKKGYVSTMSGLRGAGKSSVISDICLDCVQEGNNVGVFSGELNPKNFMKWMNLQAAGKGYVEPTQFEGYYTVPKRYQEDIAKWLGKHFWLYNNEYGNNFTAILEQFEQQIEQNDLDILILDNLMAFDINNLADTKYDAQTQFVLKLQALAKSKNVHILFVAHPRKAMGFLRLDDISGTADLANAVDNAFIVHRVNNDFMRLTKAMFGWHDDYDLYSATNVIEIAKDRDGGVQDFFIPLYYETESKRLKNSLAENKIYGWNNDEFIQISDMEEIPF